jgi:hypothetical protein
MELASGLLEKGLGLEVEVCAGQVDMVEPCSCGCECSLHGIV